MNRGLTSLFVVGGLAVSSFARLGPNYGVSDAEMDRRGRDWFLDLSEQRKGAPLAEYEVRGALGTYTAAVKRVNAKRIAALPSAERPRVTKFVGDLETFATQIVLAEQAISGGGTMYLTFAMFAQSDATDAAKTLLTRKATSKTKHVVSDVTKQLSTLERTVKTQEDDYGMRPEALAALGKARTAFNGITSFLKTRPRAESDFVLAFCLKAARFSSLP